MKRTERFRNAGADFLDDLDTRLMEFYLGAYALVNGWQVNSVDAEGKSLAPFLSSALPFMPHQKEWWVFALVTIGTLKIVVMILGWFCQRGWLCLLKTPFGARALMSFIATLMWTIMTVAIVTGGQPTVVGVRYGLAALVSVLVFMSLSIRHRVDRRGHTQLREPDNLEENLEAGGEGAN